MPSDAGVWFIQSRRLGYQPSCAQTPDAEEVQDVRFIDAHDFTADRPWGARDMAAIDDATLRLHWTDSAYPWHVNDGPEVFVVLDGAVDMHYRQAGAEYVEHLVPGRICYCEPGDEHRAIPVPEARILVIERRGSV